MKRALEEFGALSPAEQALIEGVGAGETVEIGPGLPPPDAGPDRTIRAGLLRYLLLGGCAALPRPVPEAGVRLRGARISGVLNLRDVGAGFFLEASECRFDAQLYMPFARISGLYLIGCHFPGLEAPMLVSRASVLFDGSVITGLVRLPGARVGGVLRCVGTRMDPGGPVAMELHGLEIRGSVVLTDARITGAVDLKSGKISGGVECSGAHIRAAPGNPLALSLHGAGVRNNLILDRGARIEGLLDLSAAQVHAIQDERASWPGQGDLILDQFQYGGFAGSDINAAARKRWLALQEPARWAKDFWPQPWEQCARVLRDMGQPGDARAILIDKEIRQRAARRARLRWPVRALRWSLDTLMGGTTRYGLRPLLAVVWLTLFWLVGVGVFHAVEQAGAFKPNNVLSQRSPEWAACAPDYLRPPGGPSLRWRPTYAGQLDCFRDQPEGRGYPAFNPWIYSADTLLPIVDMEMQSQWVPDDRQGRAGMFGRYYLWWQIAVGWGLSLLLVAGISGLVKPDDAR